MATMNQSRGTDEGTLRVPRGLARKAQLSAEDFDAPQAPRQVFGPWLTSEEACDYLRYTGKHRLRSLYKFIERTGVNVHRRGGRNLLLKRTDLDAAVGVHTAESATTAVSRATRKK